MRRALQAIGLLGALALAAGAAEPVSLPFEIENNKVIVATRINGSAPLRLALDTGMVDGVLLNSPSAARALGLRPQGRVTVEGAGAGAPVRAEVAYGATVDLGSERLEWQPVVIMPRGSEYVRLSRCLSFGGIIGHSLFSRYVVAIDNESGRVTLHDPQRFQYGGEGIVIPMSIEDKKPYVVAQVTLEDGTTLPVKLAVDTGAAGALYLNAGSDPRIVVPSAHVETTLGRGVLGKRRGRIGRVPALRLGPIELEGVVAGFPDAPIRGLATDRNGLLGNDLLRRFNVTLDYLGGRLILRRHRRTSEPFEYDMVGLQFDPGGERSCTLKIDEVVDGSPAQAAGVRLGDVLVAVDGRPAAELSLSAIHALFRQGPGHEVRLELRRGRETVAVTVRSRRLI